MGGGGRDPHDPSFFNNTNSLSSLFKKRRVAGVAPHCGDRNFSATAVTVLSLVFLVASWRLLAETWRPPGGCWWRLATDMFRKTLIPTAHKKVYCHDGSLRAGNSTHQLFAVVRPPKLTLLFAVIRPPKLFAVVRPPKLTHTRQSLARDRMARHSPESLALERHQQGGRKVDLSAYRRNDDRRPQAQTDTHRQTTTSADRYSQTDTHKRRQILTDRHPALKRNRQVTVPA